MRVVAVYNLKGGVGKTTAAVNLSYLSAAAGVRTLLWDLDPQAASSFAFRIRPRVADFGRKSLESGHTLAAAIKGTDFDRLDLLPADFAYRKLDRLLDSFDKPQRVFGGLLDAVGQEYDTIFLDCPPGFSLLTESVLAASDLVLVPTIPTVLSLRTLGRLIKWADRCHLTPVLAAFLSMVDGRKTLHRRACQWSALHPEIFLAAEVPYASVVEQMAVRRMPLATFATGDPAALAFRTIWTELQARLHPTKGSSVSRADSSMSVHAIEALIGALESAGSDSGAFTEVPCEPEASLRGGATAQVDVQIVHSFDTEHRDLRQHECTLELRERSGGFLVVAARSDADGDVGASHSEKQVHVQIDRRWAMQILAGALSPLAALEKRLGQPTPRLVAEMRRVVHDRPLRRVDSSTTTTAIRVA